MTTIKILRDCIEYYYNDTLHRTDGPAVLGFNGRCVWYLHGRRHREDGPAIEWNNGKQEWLIDGKLVDTSYHPNNITIYHSYEYINLGIYHREDGPAIEWNNGKQEWLQYGMFHRENGPAVEYTDKPSNNEYWLCGVKYRKTKYLKLLKLDSLV